VAKGTNEVGMVSTVHGLILLLYLAIPALILYWVVRLAVRHEMRHAARDSRKQ